MVEIALATAIIAIGISSILVLFPIGINATRAAMDENCYPDAAETVARFVRSKYLSAWRIEADTAAIGTMPAFPETLPTAEKFPEEKKDDPGENATLTDTAFTETVKVDGTDIKSGLQQYSNGVYKFTRAGYNGEEIFSATVKIWSKPADLKTASDTSSAKAPLYIPNTTNNFNMALVDGGITLEKPDGAPGDGKNWKFGAFAQSAMVEISWKDNVRTFRVDIYNPYYIIPPATPTP